MYIQCAYTRSVSFEWDEEKRRVNLRKHRVEFADAVSAFEDPNAITLSHDDTEAEDRFITLGSDLFGRLLVIAYTWRGDTIRLISARKATAESVNNTENDDATRIRFYEGETRSRGSV